MEFKFQADILYSFTPFGSQAKRFEKYGAAFN